MAVLKLHVTDDFIIDTRELEWLFSTSSGPGGQHANRSQTRAEVRWNIANSVAGSDEQRSNLLQHFGTLIIIRADEHRSQKRNKDEALRRLSAKIRQELVVATPRKRSSPTRSAKRKRADSKTQRGRLKQQRQRPSMDD
jgi:ribosome-associated protein|tara:strand:+ start:206 stop:622 length:417 start_codon:yes stop_codon:yes gene_type:complete